MSYSTIAAGAFGIAAILLIIAVVIVWREMKSIADYINKHD